MGLMRFSSRPDQARCHRQWLLQRGFWWCFWVIFSIVLVTARTCPAGMNVMTNTELSDIQGGDVRIDISEEGYYGHGETTVVRFAADIYIETYAQIGALKLGHYSRSNAELGNMATLHSVDTARYIQDRVNPTSGPWGETAVVGAAPPANFGNNNGPEWTQWDVYFEHMQLGTSGYHMILALFSILLLLTKIISMCWSVM